MKPKECNRERYLIDKIKASTLEGNLLNSPVNRDLRIYLPPGYYDNEEKRYPVIYFLHGYGGNNHNWTITSSSEEDKALPIKIIPKKFLKLMDIDKITNYEKIDSSINQGKLQPFILVQPDGSLHLPQNGGNKNLRGLPVTKGSYYINSPFTGNYMDYIIQDVINYIDLNYRTFPNKQYRAIMGGSMGGAGTLRLAIHHPEKFNSAAALSPGNLSLDLLEWKLSVPLFEELIGEELSKKRGALTWADILDTCDRIFSMDNPLVPSIKKDDKGNIIEMNKKALQNWLKHDINTILKEKPKALKEIHLLLNCEENDEFGLANATIQIHKNLKNLGIEHQFEIYSDPNAALSPHMLGIAYHIIPAIRFCTKFFPTSSNN